MTRKPDQPSIFQNPWIGYIVPILSFGGTFLGIGLIVSGLDFNIQFAAFGSVLGSILLAYLAFLRPRKDIVSLSTPIYAIIFFAYPVEFWVGVILQLLYAAGLLVLVIRLNRRFGIEDIPVLKGSLTGPLQEYVTSVRDQFPDQPGFVADGGGEAFASFARGDYKDSAEMAQITLKEFGGSPDHNTVIRSFAIIAEQAHHMEHTLETPAAYMKFLPEQETILAHPTPVSDPEKEYFRTIYNALLILFALAWSEDPEERARLQIYRTFAEKLFAE